MITRDQFSESAARFLADEMKKKERKDFLEKIYSDPLLANEFLSIRQVWEMAGGADERFRDTRSAWNRLQSRLENQGLIPREKNAVQVFSLAWVRIAAAVLFVAASFMMLRMVINTPGKTNEYLSFHASGNSMSLDLPDGSRAFLNKGSELTYNTGLSEERQVEMKGEAFFEVMADPEKPFIVTVSDTRITVKGTSFNLKENKQDGNVELFVQTGKVSIANTAITGGKDVLPGQFAVSTGKEISLASQYNPNYLSWKTKEFHFENESLDKVLRTISEAYHTNIETKGFDPAELRISSAYSRQSVESVLQTISLLYGLELKENPDGFILKKSEE